MIRRERKNRVIINIRGLNKVTITDFYFMPLQSKIVSAIIGCQYISVFDATGFFHQWLLVRVIDRHKSTVVSHRNQKQFNVTMMNFKNSPPYIQKKFYVILRVYRQFSRVYINYIITFNHILDEHISYLYSVFQLFDFYGINLSFEKSFLNYFTVVLLKQKTNVFCFIIATEKFKTISKLNFPYTFKNFKMYLYGFVFGYTQKTDAFQRMFFRQLPSNKNTTRKIFSRKTIVENLTNEKFESYRQFQKKITNHFFNQFFQRNFVLHRYPCV